MAKIYCKSSYLLRKDTSENWGNKNPVLRKGEQGLETDTGIIKIGDGVTAFNSLSDDNIYLPKRYANSTFSNALKGSKSGSAILIDDVSPVSHDIGVKVRGKNLFDINGFINLKGNSTYYGINDNGELYVKQSDFRDDTTIPAFITLEAGTYTLSSTTAITSNFKLINLTDNKTIAFSNNSTFSIEKVTSLGVKCWQSANTVIGKFQLELGTTATAYTPYVPDLTVVKVTKYGTNLIDGLLRSNSSIGSGINIQYLPDEDCYLLNGTCTDTVDAYIISHNFLINDYITTTIITVSGSVALNGGYAVFYSGYKDSVDGTTYNWSGPDISYSHSVTSSSPRLYLSTTKFYITKGVVFEDYKVKIQVAKGKNAAEYEPFIASNEYTPTADGTVEGVTSLYPNTTLMTDTEGVIIDCEYNRDINKAFAALEAAIVTNS